MNVLMLARGVAGLALPVAIAVAARHRRPPDGPTQAEPVVEGPPRLRLARSDLERYLGEGRDPRALDLRAMKLDKIDCEGLRLDSVDISEASLRGARLEGASLRGAVLRHADVSEADLRGADLADADLLEATLWKADLRGAQLAASRHLITATVRRARFDATTTWPPGFDPIEAGAIR